MTGIGEPPNKSELHDAASRYRLLVEKNPDDVRLQTNLAWSYERVMEFKQAIEEFRRALKIDPMHTDAQYGLGLALLGNHQIEEALESFERARKLANQSEDRGYMAVVHHHVDVFFRRYHHQA
jgi:tetratricopeptide (TPR) repeat protein